MDSTVAVAIIGLLGLTVSAIIAGIFGALRFFREEKTAREVRLDAREADFWKRVDEREAGYERQIDDLKTYYESKLAELENHYELQLKSLRASMVEMQHMIDRLQAENNKLKSGKNKI